MRRKIYKNPYTPSHETYFIPTNFLKSRDMEDDKYAGIGISFFKGQWTLKMGQLYYKTFKSEFPVVGEIDIDNVLCDAILKEIERGKLKEPEHD